MKTIIGINNLVQVDQLAYANHLQFWFRLGVMKGQIEGWNEIVRGSFHKDSNIKTKEPIEFALGNPRRMSIDRMRNFVAKVALEGDFDYILFLDDDVLLPNVIRQGNELVSFNTWKLLTEANKDVVAGVTHIRGYPYYPMIFNFTDDAYKENSYVEDYMQKAGPDGLLTCDAVGFSCCLIRVSLLKKMIPPFFITSDNQTEDVFFCKRAKEQVPDVSIAVQTRIHTAHILGSDVIEPSNVHLWREFDEQRFPTLKEESEKERERKKRQDRTPEEMTQLLENFQKLSQTNET